MMKTAWFVLMTNILMTTENILGQRISYQEEQIPNSWQEYQDWQAYQDFIKTVFMYGEDHSKSSNLLNPLYTDRTHGYFEEPFHQGQRSSQMPEDSVVRSGASRTGYGSYDIQTDNEINAPRKDDNTKCKKDRISCNPNAIYRSYDGSCNNLRFPEWGMSFTAQARFLPPQYDNGVDSPQEVGLPSPRLVSNILFATTTEKSDNLHTGELMAWGQFMAHDFVNTPMLDGNLNCCLPENVGNPACHTIVIPEDDPHFTSKCMNFVRSTPATVGCLPGHREQINELTSFIDGSVVYGSTVELMSKLRSFTGGKMKTSEFNLLPENPDGTGCKRLDFTRGDYCQFAGDPRPNETPNLGVNHLLFLRHHNRIAEKLSKINQHWNDERIFQETRKIIAALLQHITYKEYLPPILGHDHMACYDLYVTNTGFQDMYNPLVNPAIRNAFATAPFRFGHSQIMPIQAYLHGDYRTIERFPLEEHMRRSNLVVGNNGSYTHRLIRWLTVDKSMKSDRFFQKEVRDLLFLTNGTSKDLPATTIQRGRDHALASYTHFREFCGLSVPTTFSSLAKNGLNDHNDLERKFQFLYKSVDDIDLFAGGMSEKNVDGGEVGPTFACLLSKQFEALKKGDRFWYERPDPQIGFTLEQLNSIKRVTLSKVICDNFNLPYIQKDALKVINARNGLLPCSSLHELDLNLWREY